MNGTISSIPDGRLRELISSAIACAQSNAYPFFVAVGYGVGKPQCFTAAMPVPLPEFLSGCARFSFPHWHELEDADAARLAIAARKPLDYASVTDCVLKGILEKLVERVMELGFECFAGVRLPYEDPAADCTTVCCLPAEAAAHMSLCFRIAAASGLASSLYAPTASAPAIAH